MAMKILLVALLVFVCTGYAKDIPYSLDEDMCGQCPTILSKLKDHTLAQMESLTSEDRLLTLCDLEDPDLQEQCYELLGEHGEEFMEMLKSVDEGLMCEEICKHLEDTDQDDYKLYFQAERGATNTDVEDVGGFACSICKKFMTLIHVYLSNRRNQAIVIRLLKAACRFVPFFHTECNLIVSMYGRLIINLAARYLSPRLCYSFRLCPRNLPELTRVHECEECEFAVGLLKDTMRDRLANARLQNLGVYFCETHAIDMKMCKRDLHNLVPIVLHLLRRSPWLGNICETMEFCDRKEIIGV